MIKQPIKATKKTKITFALASLLGGGIQKATLQLIKQLLSNGYPVRLIVVNGDGPFRDEIPNECEFFDLKAKRTLYTTLKFGAILLKTRPLYLISSQTHLNTLLIILRIFIGYPRKLIVCEHIAFNENIVKSKNILERFRPLLMRLFYPLASNIVAVSTSVQQSIKKYTGIKNNIHIIHNGVNINEITELSEATTEHPWLHQKDKKIILGIGRLTPQKNFAELIHAFSLLKGQQYYLIILGDGPELVQLKKLSFQLNVNTRVDFPGFIKNPFPFLASADLFVLSSKWEGFANVVLEALACGTPIVATDCPGGPSDILDGKSFAKIVPVNDLLKMASAIKELLTVEFEKSEIAVYAKNFNILNTSQNYLNLINDLQETEN